MALTTRLLIALAVFVALGSATRVMVEVHFDLALSQESETGYTAAHTVSEYLDDQNMLWMRYFHTLASGAAGVAPMRVALMEFKNVKGWAAFEQQHLEATHILYDLFWINWRRQLWYESPETPETPTSKSRDATTPSGYVWAYRYSGKKDKQAEVDAVFAKYNRQIKDAADGAQGFLESRTYHAGGFQSDYSTLTTWEFSSMKDLTDFVFGNPTTQAFLQELVALSDKYSATVLVPSTDQNGGQIFAAKGSLQGKKK